MSTPHVYQSARREPIFPLARLPIAAVHYLKITTIIIADELRLWQMSGFHPVLRGNLGGKLANAVPFGHSNHNSVVIKNKYPVMHAHNISCFMVVLNVDAPLLVRLTSPVPSRTIFVPFCSIVCSALIVELSSWKWKRHWDTVDYAVYYFLFAGKLADCCAMAHGQLQ